jgi:thiamine pyrophosphokinase
MFNMSKATPTDSGRQVLIAVGGPASSTRWPDTNTTSGLGEPPTVVAADSGAGHALAAGLKVDVLVGDLDSIDAKTLAAVNKSGATVQQHPVDKDQSDLELALDVAVAFKPDVIYVVSSSSGRLDHLLIGVLLLGRPDLADIRVEAWIDDTIVIPVSQSERALPASVGDLVTLIPWGGPAVVTTTRLKWPLTRDTLMPGTARGLSNEVTGAGVTVRTDVGTVLACVLCSAAAPS